MDIHILIAYLPLSIFFPPGGQFNMAKLIPGKEEFHETLRYFGKQLEINKVVYIGVLQCHDTPLL